MAKEYEKRGIPEEILLDTLYDIVRWCEVYTGLKGRLWLGELCWLRRHMNLKLFKLGRLQFCMAESEFDIPSCDVKRGDPVIEVHIPAGEKLDLSECRASLARAKKFFAEFFPEFEYKCFTCHSWLLDSALSELLPEGSNILRFRELFDVTEEEESCAALKYVFRWDTYKGNLKDAVPCGAFAVKLKRFVLAGGVLHESVGVIKR